MRVNGIPTERWDQWKTDSYRKSSRSGEISQSTFEVQRHNGTWNRCEW